MNDSSTRNPATTPDEHRLPEEGAARLSEPFHLPYPQSQSRAGATMNLFDPHLPEPGLSCVSEVTTRPDPNAVSSFYARYDGRRDGYDGSYYDRLQDASFYARVTRMRQVRRPERNFATNWPPKEMLPDAEDSKTMASMGIRFEGGRFHFREFHYDRLDDAVNYAKLVARWPKEDQAR